jgi:hypothetical protein
MQIHTRLLWWRLSGAHWLYNLKLGTHNYITHGHSPAGFSSNQRPTRYCCIYSLVRLIRQEAHQRWFLEGSQNKESHHKGEIWVPHDPHHRLSCFKKDTECRALFPKLPHNETVLDDQSTGDPVTFHRLVEGEEQVQTKPWLIYPKRTLGCEYINQHSYMRYLKFSTVIRTYK